MNNFYDTPGDLSIQLAPWELTRRGFVNKRTAIYELRKAIKFNSAIAGGVIVVPLSFLSDLASIPSFAWGIFMSPSDPRIELGGWVHDFIYSHKGDICPEGATKYRPLTRKECDAILAFEAMADLGASKFQQYVVYYALRLLGSGSFNTDPAQIRWKFAKLNFKKPIIK
jgi:hypothetical protein